jgi:hypothetical protein
LQVVNPIAYLVQKLLVLPTRGEKQGKDLLYIFDTLTIFGSSLAQLGDEAPGLIEKLTPKQTRSIRSCAQRLCFLETKVSHEAEIIAASQRNRAPSSSQIVGACELGLRRVLQNLINDL